MGLDDRRVSRWSQMSKWQPEEKLTAAAATVSDIITFGRDERSHYLLLSRAAKLRGRAADSPLESRLMFGAADTQASPLERVAGGSHLICWLRCLFAAACSMRPLICTRPN